MVNSKPANKHALRIARWHNHINHVQAPKHLRHWLTESGSLTAKLIAHSASFQVQRTYQGHGDSWADEYAPLGLHRVSKVHAREVLLRCDNVPTVYAHTVLPLNANSNQWPLFKRLGNKSLGSTLFQDPQVKRGNLQFARLPPRHPARQRARLLSGHEIQFDDNHTLFARRSLFFRRGGVMLVMELFLPGIEELRPSSTVLSPACARDYPQSSLRHSRAGGNPGLGVTPRKRSSRQAANGCLATREVTHPPGFPPTRE